MAEAPLGFFDYLREAFYRKVPVPGLGHLPANLMALGAIGVLGIANPGFWFLGAALELTYLVGVAGSGRFQKLVQGERLMSAQRQWEEQITGAVSRLRPGLRERYQHLLGQCRKILGLSETLDTASLGSFRHTHARNLNQLLGIFLRLLGSRQLIEDNVQNLNRKSLEEEIRRLESNLAGAGDNEALVRAISGTLDIQRRRLENLDRADANLRVIDAELQRIERQVELLREESALTGGPARLSERLDAVTSVMGETSRWFDEHADFFGSLGGGEAASPVPDLPQLPGLAEEG